MGVKMSYYIVVNGLVLLTYLVFFYNYKINELITFKSIIMYSKDFEEFLELALADGMITDKEKAVIYKKGLAEGIDPDELDLVIKGRLSKMKKEVTNVSIGHTKPIVANEKLGNVVKCPNCGAQIIGGHAVCPECGYAFTNVAANSSYEKLSQKLQEVDQKNFEASKNSFLGKVGFNRVLGSFGDASVNNEKMTIISTFPVPNARGDLLEFLSSIKDLANKNGDQEGYRGDYGLAYWKLYSNCINKAKISFANEKEFAPYFEDYEKRAKKRLFGSLFG